MAELYVKTSMERGIDAGELRTHRDRYDRACKRLLSEKEILGWILHECLDEFADVAPSDIAARYIDGEPEVSQTPVHADDAASPLITGMDSEDSSIDEGTVWYDIRFSAIVPGTKDRVGMIVNVEAQGDFYPGYPLLKRATYYCGRMISSQYGRVFTKSRYDRLRKVCSIWICPNPPAEFGNTINRYTMTEQHLVGAAQLDHSEYDLIEIVLACPNGDRQQKGDGILRLLGTLIASEKSADERKAIISEEFGIPMSERLSEEVVEMSNVSKGLEERWYHQGLDKGYTQGMREGHERGVREGYDSGVREGHERGVREGHERGVREAEDRFTHLAKELHARGRDDEMLQALQDKDKLALLLEEFSIA